ncbi:hypothetical protein H6P81_014245 [Aristolochia fimbriata]|uniref:Uncharacterized protein n=1 Tax=Aristolochia fimbriata TaxID=158543 RepID=A0AAV7EH11_ARIFI|nr:hypothetical protein H6P81_014245 [Aristolochia fimbriata]
MAPGHMHGHGREYYRSVNASSPVVIVRGSSFPAGKAFGGPRRWGARGTLSRVEARAFKRRGEPTHGEGGGGVGSLTPCDRFMAKSKRWRDRGVEASATHPCIWLLQLCTEGSQLASNFMGRRGSGRPRVAKLDSRRGHGGVVWLVTIYINETKLSRSGTGIWDVLKAVKDRASTVGGLGSSNGTNSCKTNYDDAHMMDGS